MIRLAEPGTQMEITGEVLAVPCPIPADVVTWMWQT